jgi:NodT family efflux transporter outer membrane factor (OMF) lipoprotein
LATQADLSRWWLQFGDAKMQTLIDRALKSNLDLLTAVSRVREARQQEIIAGASGLPQINASGLAAHVHSNLSLLSKLGAPFAPGGPPPGSTDIKLYSVGFDAPWEIDIFGGVRRGVEAARANTEAAVWQMRDGEVTLTAEIATDYMTLRALQARVAFLREEEQRQIDTSPLVAARAKAGFVTRLDVNRQSALASSTAAQIPPLQAQARMMEHAIAVLMGEPPEAMIDQLDTASEMPAIPSSLPAGLPSDLLRRRSDIRVAERNLAAATAQVGVAVADLYPKFDLITAVSLASKRPIWAHRISYFRAARNSPSIWSRFTRHWATAGARPTERAVKTARGCWRTAYQSKLRYETVQNIPKILFHDGNRKRDFAFMLATSRFLGGYSCSRVCCPLLFAIAH